MTEEYKMSMREFTMRRNIDTICSSCSGLGVRAYGSTSTWRGGMGGQAITNGICDKCWGSGDESRPWLNLKKLDRIMCDECKNKMSDHNV